LDWLFRNEIPAALPHTVIRALCWRSQLHPRSVSRPLADARGSGTPVLGDPCYEEDRLTVDQMGEYQTYVGSVAKRETRPATVRRPG